VTATKQIQRRVFVQIQTEISDEKVVFGALSRKAGIISNQQLFPVICGTFDGLYHVSGFSFIVSMVVHCSRVQNNSD
jgi:hypothetical protein